MVAQSLPWIIFFLALLAITLALVNMVFYIQQLSPGREVGVAVDRSEASGGQEKEKAMTCQLAREWLARKDASIQEKEILSDFVFLCVRLGHL